eukprot:381293-Rhodomonas_salina.4
MFSAHGVPESYVKAGDPYKEQIEKCAEMIMAEVTLLTLMMVEYHARDTDAIRHPDDDVQAGAVADERWVSLQVNRDAKSKFDYTLCFQSRVGYFPSPPPHLHPHPHPPLFPLLLILILILILILLSSRSSSSSSLPCKLHITFVCHAKAEREPCGAVPVKWLEPYTDTVLEELGASGLKNLVSPPSLFLLPSVSCPPSLAAAVAVPASSHTCTVSALRVLLAPFTQRRAPALAPVGHDSQQAQALLPEASCTDADVEVHIAGGGAPELCVGARRDSRGDRPGQLAAMPLSCCSTLVLPLHTDSSLHRWLASPHRGVPGGGRGGWHRQLHARAGQSAVGLFVCTER